MAIQVQLLKTYLKATKRNGRRECRWKLRWFDPATGVRRCESTGTADKTAAEALLKIRWAELNIPGAAPEPDPVVVAKPMPTWLECRAALQRAMEADNCRPNYVRDSLMTLECLRREFLELDSPALITAEMANEYKRRRAESKPTPSPWTIRGDLSTLKAIFGKWLMSECGLLESNPFAKIKPPKCEAPEVRIMTVDEQRALFEWLAERWNNWRLPALFLEVAELVGWRVTEIASMREDDILEGGYIRVKAETSKTRKTKYGNLPAELHAELKGFAAGGWAFGRFPDDLRRLLILWKRSPNHAARVRDFAPHRLVAWLQDEVQRFHADQQQAENEAAAKQGREPETLPTFTLHDFRRTAISAMQMDGVSEKDASVQVGCTPEVMRRHYERLDGMAIAKRNSDKRLAGRKTSQLHEARRASDARGETTELDDASNRIQTIAI